MISIQYTKLQSLQCMRGCSEALIVSFAIEFPSTNPILPKQQNSGVSILILKSRHQYLHEGWVLMISKGWIWVVYKDNLSNLVALLARANLLVQGIPWSLISPSPAASIAFPSHWKDTNLGLSFLSFDSQLQKHPKNLPSAVLIHNYQSWILLKLNSSQVVKSNAGVRPWAVNVIHVSWSFCLPPGNKEWCEWSTMHLVIWFSWSDTLLFKNTVPWVLYCSTRSPQIQSPKQLKLNPGYRVCNLHISSCNARSRSLEKEQHNANNTHLYIHI
jgi:hypothetical protein